MFFLYFRKNKNIIEVYYNQDVKYFFQHIINKCLIICRYISQSKKHNLILVISVPRSKGDFLFFSFFYFNQIIGPSQIDCNKNRYFLYSVLQFFCIRDRISILYRDIIYFIIIDTQSITAVFFNIKNTACFIDNIDSLTKPFAKFFSKYSLNFLNFFFYWSECFKR